MRFLIDYGAQASKVKRVGLHQMEAWEEEIVGFEEEKYINCEVSKYRTAQFEHDQLDKHKSQFFSSVTLTLILTSREKTPESQGSIDHGK